MADVLVDNSYKGAWNSSFRWKLPWHHTKRRTGTYRRRYSNWPALPPPPCILYHSVTLATFSQEHWCHSNEHMFITPYSIMFHVS